MLISWKGTNVEVSLSRDSFQRCLSFFGFFRHLSFTRKQKRERNVTGRDDSPLPSNADMNSFMLLKELWDGSVSHFTSYLCI